MSSDDLEIHQPADTPRRKQCLPVIGSLGDDPDGILQQNRSIPRGRSLPSLLDVSSYQNNEDDADFSPGDDTDAINHREEQKPFIKVVVEQK